MKKILQFSGWGRVGLIIIIILCCAACLKLGNLTPKIPSITGASYVGNDRCLECHEEIGSDFKKNIHNRLADFEVGRLVKGCEACHGPGSLHLENAEDEKAIFRYKKLSTDEVAELCMSCHREQTIAWAGSAHSSHDAGCLNCHKMHQSPEKKLLRTGEMDVCYACHREKQAQMSFPSHHPIREGKMKCSGCHSPHDPEKEYVSQGTVNDLCYNCHAEYQGPFVYEHPPVSEDCSICHDPHGTVANNLLKQNDPYLCLRCHRGHIYKSPSPVHPDAKQSVFLTACIQCHSQIHGTDLPSRATGKGRLTR